MNLLFKNSKLSQALGLENSSLYFDQNQSRTKFRTFIIKGLKLNSNCPDIRNMQNIESVTQTIINTFPEFKMNAISWHANIDVNRKKITSNIRITTNNISDNFMKQEQNIRRPQIWNGITFPAWSVELCETGNNRKYRKQQDMEMKINDKAQDEIIEKYNETIMNLMNNREALQQELTTIKQRFTATFATAIKIRGIQLLSQIDISELAKTVDLEIGELLANSRINHQKQGQFIYFAKCESQGQHNDGLDLQRNLNLSNSSRSSATELFQDLLPTINKYQSFKAEIQKRSQQEK